MVPGFDTVRPQVADNKLMDDLLANNVEVIGKEPERQSLWTQLLVAAFPILIIIAVFMFFMRQMQGGGGGKGPDVLWQEQGPADERRSDQDDLCRCGRCR